MTSTPISYDVVKVSELQLIDRSLNGNDEIIVNDLAVSPTETKRCRVIDLANSIQQYILPIATSTELGGVKIGDGLTINPTSGVLTTDVVNFGDLGDVTLTTPSQNQIVIYDGAGWVNTDAAQVFVEMLGGDGIEITGKGTNQETINVKPGGGIEIVNDEVAVSAGRGISIINGSTEVNVGLGLEHSNNTVKVNPEDPIYINNAAVGLRYANGLIVNTNSSALEVDPNVVVFKDSSGDINLTGDLSVSGEISGSSAVITGSISASNAVFVGDVTAANLISVSDANLKDNVKTIESALGKVNDLRGVTFDWKVDGKAGMGVIAQELEAVIPSLVVGDTQKAVNYNGLIGVLIEAVKELSKEVEELKNK